MNELKNAIQAGTFKTSEELSAITRKAIEVGATADMDKAMLKMKPGVYLENMSKHIEGLTKPSDMFDPHAHHISFKVGKPGQEAIVEEIQDILRYSDIDPIFGIENYCWAPNRVPGQHSTEALQSILDDLKDSNVKGNKIKVSEVLDKHGKKAAGLKHPTKIIN